MPGVGLLSLTLRLNRTPATAWPGRRFTRTAAVVLGAGLFAACAGNSPMKIAAPFNPAQARVMLDPGNNHIVGRALLWLSSGGVISCAGESATLYPATHYAYEWARLTYESVENGKFKPPDFAYRPKSEGPVNLIADPAFLETSRSVACDNDGNFSFERVGDGEYYVVARIAWQQHIWDEYNFFYGNEYQGMEGTVLKKVRVRGGEKAVANMMWSAPNSRFNLW
jgi:hypothetical protein